MKAIKLLPLLLLAACTAKEEKSYNGYPITQVPFTSVHVTDNTFWGDRLQTSATVTSPYCLDHSKYSGRIKKFIWAGEHNRDTSKVFEMIGAHYDDSDVYKILEGASYTLRNHYTEEFDARIDSLIGIIAAAQEPDGYLMTARTINPKHPAYMSEERWVSTPIGSHEMYMLGHLIEAAVAHKQATGKDNLLNVAIRFADCMCEAVGPEENKLHIISGHEEIELALVKLYLITGNKKYFDQAKYLLDLRGNTPEKENAELAFGMQAHIPVTQQKEAVGHAVRAEYLYCGMADVAAISDDEAYKEAIDAIWEDIVSGKYYLTGGVGATNNGEAFGPKYCLPNAEAYCETCAQVAHVMFNYRQFLFHGESKYYDVLERTLYNSVLSGMGLTGNMFFYDNPLRSREGYCRSSWFWTCCCPSNLCRFIPSMPQYVYATKDNSIYMNLFVANESKITLEGKEIGIKVDTDYPWNGDVHAEIQTPAKFELKIRIPGWVRGEVVPSDLYYYNDGKNLAYKVKVNGIDINSELEDGYFCISRRWEKGDNVSIHFDMEARFVKANENVEADRGMVAVERGPLVYCAEWPDNTVDVFEAKLDYGSPITPGSVSIEGREITSLTNNGITLIPYYAWAHRGVGHMSVWLKE